MTITIIIVCCWILYKTGKAAAMLEAFRIYGPQPAKPEPLTASEDPEEPKREPTPERLKLEAVAMNILLYKGVDTAPARVKRLSNSELNNIIDTFKNELNI